MTKTKRETLLEIARAHLNEPLQVEWFKEHHPEFLYSPDVAGAKKELDSHLIEGLLWDYKVTIVKINAGDETYRETAKSITIRELSENDKEKVFYVFLQLAKPNDDGCAKVDKKDFDKAGLKLGNGGSWCRDSSKLAMIFNVIRHKDLQGDKNTITSVELKGWNRDIQFSQRIKKSILDALRDQNCAMFGVSGKSENTKIEIDHKDGRKNDCDFNNVSEQKKEWFQPLCKAANDFKRQKCKECKESGKRWSAANIAGFEGFEFYEGNDNYDEVHKCVGCYLYDPVQYRKKFREFVIKDALKGK